MTKLKYLLTLLVISGNILSTLPVYAGRHKPVIEQNADTIKKTVRILSIDGGGIRGVIPAFILCRVNEQLNALLSKPVRIADSFDIIAGTSTGGIIALALATPSENNSKTRKYDPKAVLGIYEEKGEEIFPAKSGLLKGLFSPTHESKNLERILGEYVGETKLSQALNHVLITAYETHGNEMRLFDSKMATLLEESEDLLMKDVARGTSAAPTYLPSAEVKNRLGDLNFIDGGVFANNPTWLALERAMQWYPKADDFLIVSLGTGKSPREDLTSKVEDAGKVGWGPRIASLMMGNAAKMVEDIVKTQQALHIAQGHRFEYVRIQSQIHQKNKKMDDAGEENIRSLLGYARSSNEDISTIVEHLLRYYTEDKGILLKKDYVDPDLRRLRTILNLSENDETISFADENYTDEKIKEIALHYGAREKVTRLDFSNNQITRNGIESIIQILKANPSIKELILDGNSLRDKGIEKLRTLITSNRIKLKLLSLKNVRMGDKSALAFGDMRDIEVIKMGLNKKLTPETIALLKRNIALDFSGSEESVDPDSDPVIDERASSSSSPAPVAAPSASSSGTSSETPKKK